MNVWHLGYLIVLSSLVSACMPPIKLSNGAPSPAPDAIEIYKSRGSKQCEGGGSRLSEHQNRLSAAGIPIQYGRCALDGLVQPAVCGNSDGKIYVFAIPKAALGQAEALGFKPLDELPRSVAIGCNG